MKHNLLDERGWTWCRPHTHQFKQAFRARKKILNVPKFKCGLETPRNLKEASAFDKENDQYLIISEGWNKSEHLHSCLIHLEIVDDKVWIQCDNTEDGIANDLVTAGIPKNDIVLAFHPPELRQYTDFAAI